MDGEGVRTLCEKSETNMWFFRYFIDALIPGISAYLASDDSFFKWLIENHILAENFDIQLWQRIFLIISIFFTTFVLYLKLAYHRKKEEQCRDEIAGLYNVVKQFAQSNFASISGDASFSFDLRIFVPETSVTQFIRNRFRKKEKREKWFIIRNIEPFARKDITEHLRLKVEPTQQGLVGQAYKSKSIVYDDSLSETNSTNYSLEESQVNRTSNLIWSVCVPITNEKNDVIAVMAFDSDGTPLNISQNKEEIRTLTNTLAIMMRDSVPELFKRKWSI